MANWNLQRLLIKFKRLLIKFKSMGASQPPNTLIHNYNCDSLQHGLKILSSKHDGSTKYLLKTYSTSSQDEHTHRLHHFRNYQAQMQHNVEIAQLVDIIEERLQNFCTHTFRTHLIFQHSPITIATEIEVRTRKLAHPAPHPTPDHPSQRTPTHSGQRTPEHYFTYQDLCNILYSCLSAMWLVREAASRSINPERRQFNTIFLSADNILVLEDGAIKVMDPQVIGYEKRYTFVQGVNYSPEKLQDFYMVDDEKCAVFELGMLMLEITLLESNRSAYCRHDFSQHVLNKKLYKARNIYSADLDKTLGVNLIDIVEKMTAKDRQHRPTLEQTIQFAEEMYEREEQAPSVPPINSSNTHSHKKHTSSGKKTELRLTNHSSSAKKMSPSLQKFHDFKDSLTQHHHADQSLLCQGSPQISNFTIQQAPMEKEESSMLQSFKVQNPPKLNLISESVLKGDIFSTLRLNDSYNYGWRGKQGQQEQIFTDPLLLQTINRELEQIELRKLKRSGLNNLKGSLNNLKGSQTLQRRDRYHMQLGQVFISNQAYLID